MTARLAMTVAFAAALVAMPVGANAKRAAAFETRMPAKMIFTGLTAVGREPARSRYMLIDDLPETYGSKPQGVQVRWRVNRVKVKVPFALN
ncbi:hypothetical protein [Flavisphingomonas formosensis]|uniref:hypothetical protein n=1 Tax=Flavisphingomonas formosensis TaxID=861534 RepID=UPI0012F92081|nr:hypothetical protein [Sphingomonas formosensis]